MRLFSYVYRSKGQDKRGVTQITGKWNGSATYCTFHFGLAGAMLLFVSVFFAMKISASFMVSCVCITSTLIVAATLAYMVIQSLSMRRHIKKLTDAASVRSRFGVNAETLNAFAEEQGIKPRYNINGEDFYDIKDFGDAAVLLRASVAPAAEPETLLRPAAGTVTDAENLLRPLNG